MADYSTIKGFTVQSYTTDPYATAVEGATWASGGALTTAVTLMAGAGSQTAALSAGGSTAPGNTAQVELYNGTSWTTSPIALNVARNSAGGCGTQTAALVTGGAPGATTANEEWNGVGWAVAGTLTTGRDGTKTFGTTTAAIYAGGDTSPGASTADSETWNGTGWSEGSNLNTDRRSRSTGGTSTAGIYAGGADYPGSAQLTVNETYNGTSWTQETAINTGRSAAGGSAQGTTAAFVMFGGALPASTAATESWNGTAWTEVSDMGTARKEIGSGGTQVVAIAFGGYSPYYTNTEEFAVGAGTAIAQEGQVWYNSGSNVLKGYGQQGTGVWASSGAMNTPHMYGGAYIGTTEAGVYAGGIPGDVTTTQTYDGSSWSASPAVLNDGRHYIEVSGIGTQNAAQLEGGESPAIVALTEQYNGTSWSEVSDLTYARIAIVGAGTQTAGLAITGGHTVSSESTTYVESWNGSSWSNATATNDSRKYGMGGGTQTSAVVAGGNQYPSPTTLNTAETWDGSSWTEVANMNTTRYGGGRGATNESAAIVFGGAPPPTLANTESWNGTAWTEVADLASGRGSIGADGSSIAAVAAGGSPPNSGLTEEFSTPNAIKTFTSS